VVPVTSQALTTNLTTPAVAIKPCAYGPDPIAVAADLRAIADAVENNQFLAALIAQAFEGAIFPMFAVDRENGDDPRVVMAETIRLLKALAAGPTSKRYSDKWFYAEVPLRAIKLRLTDEREKVCTRVVTGTETVTEEIPDPEYIAAAPKVTQTREVEVVQWQCEPLMGARTGVE
jgi:hypothetical protein